MEIKFNFKKCYRRCQISKLKVLKFFKFNCKLFREISMEKLNSNSPAFHLFFFRRQLIIYLNGNGVAVVVKICAA